MAKFNEVYQDTQELFSNFINQIDSLSEISVKILSNDKQKEICKVFKANDLLKHMTNEDAVIIVNEKIFEQLEDEQKLMVVEEHVARLYFDAEKGKLSLINPDVNTFSLLLRKYGYDKYERLNESIKALVSQEAEVEAENSK
jgi:hypothetical protein